MATELIRHESADRVDTKYLRVVVADDAPDVRFLVGMLLESAGADIRVAAEAESGPEAVEAVQRHQPDCLIIDLAMPGGNGLDAIGQVRSTHPDLPIILLTGFAGSEQLDGPAEHRADAVIPKDETIHRLAPTILEVVEARRR